MARGAESCNGMPVNIKEQSRYSGSKRHRSNVIDDRNEEDPRRDYGQSLVEESGLRTTEEISTERQAPRIIICNRRVDYKHYDAAHVAKSCVEIIREASKDNVSNVLAIFISAYGNDRSFLTYT
ncbi:hypothetical protein BKA69DRAFT_1034783 [Paraphysoderma sedebokerense]|nr:hypothetical protein BKA69DRAFT_1034783 [Paraphysoderma sedebokerense]